MMKRTYIARGVILAATLSLGACGGSGSGDTSSVGNSTVVPISTAALDVTPCLGQSVTPTRTVASLVVPADVITLDPTQASGYPNGRKLQDPVVDLSLAALFLDLTKVPVDTLARIPLDPSGNDEPLGTSFPYLAEAHGGAPVATGGAGFVFRTDAATAYTRVDRMGEPAIATVLVNTASKTAYNDDSPAQDVTGKWVPVFAADLEGLAEALRDDWAGAKLPICAVPKTST
jgi:hypothetical protein